MTEVSCRRPGTVTPDDLIAYVYGEATPLATEHIRSCPYCLEQAQSYAGVRGRLQLALRRFDCPSPLQLGEYIMDFLPSAERRHVAEHLISCPRCKSEIVERRGSLLQDTDLFPRSDRRPLTLIATLLRPRFDLAGAGLRGTADDVSQAYRAGDVTITISAGPTTGPGEPIALIGLIEPDEDEPALAGREVQLTHRGDSTRSGSVSNLGNFVFEDVPVGVYEVRLLLEDSIIIIPDLLFGVSD